VESGLRALGLDAWQCDAVDRLILEGRKVIALKVMMDASGCALVHAMAVLGERTEELRKRRPDDFVVDDAPPRPFSS
jgi:hypothetical protein